MEPPENKENPRVVIIVNGREKEVVGHEISFDAVVKLAYPTSPGPNASFTVIYRDGPPQNAEGSLIAGETVRIKKGMIFDVTPTVQS